MSRAARRKPAAALGPGAVVAGCYRLDQPLGEGGMAEVFRAEDLSTGRRVAVKVLRPDIASNPEAVERTKREGELLCQIDNPAIVQVESFGQLEDGTVFLVMELLEGETLGARMRRGLLEPAELAPIVAGTCAGLHAAHSRGIVHRDLKPDNIFLCPTEHGLQVKLLDFGISKVYGSEKLTQTGEILGTPRYMSPEQLGAEHDVDARVDVYALGVILYEALAGKPPFLASTPTDLIIAILNGKLAPLRSVQPDLPPAVEAVVMRAMSKVREARFDTAMAMAEAYIDAAGGVAAVRSQQRRGMATRAMGGMRTPASVPPPSAEVLPNTRPPPSPPGGDEVAGNLRLGTFSGLEASPAPLGPPAPDKRTAAMGASRGASIPEAPGAPLQAALERDDSWLAHASTQAIPKTRSPEEHALPRTRETPMGMADAPSPAAPPPRAVAATALMDASQALSVPAVPSPPAAAEPVPARRGGKVLLVVGALLAGAASAAVVIAVLYLYDRHRDAPEPVDAPAEADEARPATRSVALEDDGPSEPDEAEEGAPSEAEEGAPAERAAEPSTGGAPGEDEPASARPVEVENDRESARDRSRHPREPRERTEAAARREQRGRSEPAGDREREPPAADPLRDAQRALRAGDPERCVRILDDAIRQRTTAPGVALRRRAQCLDAAGQRAAAVREYQRFCRLFPENPGISEVRPLLESWGHSCP